MEVTSTMLGQPSRRNTEHSLRVAAIGLALTPVVVGCAVRDATPDGIAIVYNAMHPQMAEFQAQRHCNQFGKTAVLVETMPVRPSVETLFTRSSQSIFKCVLLAVPPQAP